ncbi:NEP1-interacting protein-like 1 isoform X2 [Oryza brachyantha]|uniref:NEP1-interacting protein-like 1 isoform X2 n=1 Tax=Oryza brachyantha TaxID=4533 RepID=UPI001ADC0033|nr:NEP1-interacting protein-like 1 isoform X2 [Oryza brachyantha]
MISSVSLVGGNITRCIVTCVFAAAGAIIGAIVGVLAGFANEDGMVQGTLIGAISGAFIAMEVVDSLAKIWCCDEYSVATRARLMTNRARSWLAQLLVFWNLLIDRLAVRTSVFPTLTTVLDSQLNAMPSRHGRAEMNGGDLFDRSHPVAGMRRAAVDELPVIKLTPSQTDATSCPICLHDFKAGESARRLPACCHIFHLACIDNWLLWHAQCPMCRRAVY